MQMLSAAIVGLDWRAFGFATGLAGATCLIVSLLPFLRIGRLDLVDALKSGARSVAGDAHERWHRWMVVTQLALVLMLLVTSGLLLRSFSPARRRVARVRRSVVWSSRKCSSRPSDIHVGGASPQVMARARASG